MTHEPFTQAIGRSSTLRLALLRSPGDRPVVVEAPVPRAVQLWIVVMFVVCALLTSCASADRADADVATRSTTDDAIASVTSTADVLDYM